MGGYNRDNKPTDASKMANWPSARITYLYD